MNKPLADDIPSVLRRRYKEYRNEGYNDESLRCLNRAADRIEALERELAEYKPLPGGVPLRQFVVEQERDALKARLVELEAKVCAVIDEREDRQEVFQHEGGLKALAAALETGAPPKCSCTSDAQIGLCEKPCDRRS